MLTVCDLQPGESGVVMGLRCPKGALRRRIIDMGVTPGVTVTLLRLAPFGDPVALRVRGYELSLRRSEAEEILIEKLGGA